VAGGISVVVVFDKLPIALSRLRPIIAREVRAQGLATEADMKANIVGAGRVDTGAMLGSTTSQMTGPMTAEVGPSAESEDGYPYPVAQEYGTVRGISGAYFATHAGEQAATDFPNRFRNLESQLL
jgi:hypothetical protein